MSTSQTKTLRLSGESGPDSTLDPVQPPERLSQSFLRHADSCARSAYLYLRHGGGGPALNLHFGTAAHLVFERMMLDLISQGEKTLYAPAEGEDPLHAAQEVASMTAAVVDEVLREHPELQVTKLGVDQLRVQAFHWATAQPVDPETVVAVERKFVLDLDSGYTVSGKVDLAAVEGTDTLAILDWKSSWPPPADESEPDEFFQLRFYALLVLFGQPVEHTRCTACPNAATAISRYRGGKSTCECRGTGWVEHRLSPIGDGINYVKPRLVYPRVLRQDGELHRRPERGVLTRTQVADFRADVERDVEKVARALETGEWPAVPGSHCSMCPCQAECPLPESARPETLDTPEDAARVLEWADRADQELRAKRRAARRYVEANGPVRWGADKVSELDTAESWKTDWQKLEAGVHAAVEYGEPFDLSMFRTRTVSTRMKTRTLTGPELDEPESLDERFGDVPF